MGGNNVDRPVDNQLTRRIKADICLFTRLIADLLDLNKPVPTRELLGAMLQDTVYLLEELLDKC